MYHSKKTKYIEMYAYLIQFNYFIGNKCTRL